MDAFASNYEKETKAMNLKRRRLKLGQLLKAERDQYEVPIDIIIIQI